MKMKVRLALFLVLVAAAVIAVAVWKFPSPRPPARPAPPPPSAPTEPSLSAQEAVRAYLQALGKKDFQAAYGSLSQASQQAHPYQDFAARCEKSGVPSYDLAQAKKKPGEGGRAVVTVPIAEDVAEADFTLVAEGGEWKVVFIGGAPSFPYPE
jgi:hypothetical protein